MHTLPIKVLSAFFRRLQHVQRQFVWAHNKTRLSFNTITLSKNAGGMGLPYFKRYYYVTHITTDWHCHDANKDWVAIENASSPFPLKFLPWIPKKKHYPQLLKQHPFIGTTLQIFHLTFLHYELASIPGPLTRIADKPEFSPGMQNKDIPSTSSGSPLLASHCLQSGLTKSKEDIQTHPLDIPTTM